MIQRLAMTLSARHLGFVEVPHLAGWILDHDEAILAAYRTSPRRLSDHRALWEARSGRRASWWAIWDGEHFTGELLASQTAAEVRLLQLQVQRAQLPPHRRSAND